VYQLNGEDHVRDWLGGETGDAQLAMLRWLPALAADPEGVASAVLRRPGVAAYTAAVPGTDAFVDYLVIDQYETVLILRVTTVSLDDRPATD